MSDCTNDRGQYVNDIEEEAMTGAKDIDEALERIADWYHDHLSEYADDRESDDFGNRWWAVGQDASDELGGYITHVQAIASELKREEQGANGCDYCKGGFHPLDITMLDVSAFSASVEAYIEGDRIVVEKYDGDLRIKANHCPMCGRKLVSAE